MGSLSQGQPVRSICRALTALQVNGGGGGVTLLPSCVRHVHARSCSNEQQFTWATHETWLQECILLASEGRGVFTHLGAPLPHFWPQ